MTSTESSLDSITKSIEQNKSSDSVNTTVEKPTKVKKKRGRKPKPKTDQPPKIPKKRGRKPKPKTDQPSKIPKKRGRKPKPKTDQPSKIPKKRGRKPKEKSYGKIKKKISELDSGNIILHLPINSKSVMQNSKEAELLTYTPNIGEPNAWEETVLGGQPINSIHFIKNLKSKNGVNNAPNYSHYPFDEKEEEIVNVLIDSDNESESGKSSDSKELNDISNVDNMIKDINIIHKDKWFEFQQPFKELNNHEDNLHTINMMKEKRKKDIESYQEKLTENSSSSLLMQFKECNKTYSWPSSTSVYCWWCCHPFNWSPSSLPCKYENGTFHVKGVFCSPECAAAYNFDNNENEEIWERYSLLNFLYKTIYNEKNLEIKLAAPRQCLKIFGGSLSIKDFRMYNSNYEKHFQIVMPPMVSIIPQQEFSFLDKGYSSTKKKFIQIDKNKIDNLSNLRLKRSTPFIESKNTLEKCMNLTLAN